MKRRRLIGLAAAALAGCASNLGPTSNAKPTFVLVHGAFQDASAWSMVMPRLESAGYKVVAVHLPGRGGDGVAPASLTLDAHRDAVLAAVRREPGPVTLVGHSFGGIAISAAAEAEPQRIARLIYVGAYLPQSGDTLQKLAESDKTNGFGKDTFQVAKDYSSASIKREDQLAVFCADCPPAMRSRVDGALLAEPLKPMTQPVALTPARFGAVPKYHVLTTQDRAVSPALQRRMIANYPGTQVAEVVSSHAPFYSQPEALARALLSFK